MTESLVASRVVGASTLEIDADKSRLDLALIQDFLANQSHWARGIPPDVVEQAIAHSLAFGLYRDGVQIGFARVVTDHATVAYLADVFIVADERHAGLGRWLIESILAYPPLGGLRRWLLGTRDAHRLYRRCGFSGPPSGFSFLERLDAAVYGPAPEAHRKIAAPI